MTRPGRKILLGVTGSIAAYKAVELLRMLQDAGYDVRVVMTQAARRFIGEMTFEALSGHPIYHDQFLAGPDGAFPHLQLARADLALIAPATAGTIGKLAAGLADDLLVSTILAMETPVMVCPAMNSGMWRNAAVRENIETLKRRGFIIVAPESGKLACGDEGEGRLASLETIVRQVNMILAGNAAPAGDPQGKSDADDERTTGSKGDLAGRRILVTAGATREPIDAVRYISNRSSGLMGFAAASAAQRRGAAVTVIACNCGLQREEGIRYVDISTSRELEQALDGELDSHEVLIMAAAVADYKVSSAETMGKIERKTTDYLQLIPTSDIVSSLNVGNHGRLIKIGFAAEYGAGDLERARRKLAEKQLDMIVFNDISRHDIGFAAQDNEITIMAPGRSDIFVGKTSKIACADRILDELKELLA